MKPAIYIDGEHFSTLDEFFRHFQEQALDGACWGSNLDSFHDVLRGGFGTPEDGFLLIWKNHLLSRSHLGYAETQRVLRRRLTTCHPANEERVQAELALAQQHQGETVFDWLVEIIRIHGPGGPEQEDGVELLLQ
mgnify:CR=1 FL=1